MAFEQHLDAGLDEALRARVANDFIREGRLFGAVAQTSLTADEIVALQRAGWSKRDYHDAPVMEAPQSTIDWQQLRRRHRDSTLHVISHRLDQGAPWVGARQEILEELMASQWEEQEDELRTLLHAFAFASMWSQTDDAPSARIESSETFFFYTERMRTTALKASQYATNAPKNDHAFWEMVSSLNDVPE
ncbi:MAG: hypothetical protein C7B45_13530 [Sulfobacillus acidophilus]|uniref:Uncharacterized protein n=1 Tax=Sulfobacillus acidophilus TaxID=53633 RepID=A0A2T2WEU1_9FIRM|nr:MAG: hypothetical protein C7B45_13530 [Sulfobacillus acidophilus]